MQSGYFTAGRRAAAGRRRPPAPPTPSAPAANLTVPAATGGAGAWTYTTDDGRICLRGYGDPEE